MSSDRIKIFNMIYRWIDKTVHALIYHNKVTVNHDFNIQGLFLENANFFNIFLFAESDNASFTKSTFYFTLNRNSSLIVRNISWTQRK